MDFSKHLIKAEEAQKRRNYDYAIELYRQLIDLDPDLGEARAGLRRALKAKHERQSGGRFLRAVGGAVPLGKAKAMRKMKKFDACARALEDFLLTNPLDEDANLTLGLVLEEAGHLNSARAVYEFVAEIAPENPEGLKRAGAMMREGREPAKALEYYERALAVDPRDREALKARKDLAAETALLRNEGEEVRHSRDLVLGADGAEGLGRLERSRRRHLSAEELEEDRARLEQRIASEPDQPQLLAEMADTCRRIGDLEAALAFAEQARALSPKSFGLVERVGELETKLLKRRLAKADIDGDAEAAAALEKELRAHEMADYAARVDLRPGDPELQLALARRQMQAGELDEAIGGLQKVQHDPRARSEALFLLARAFRDKGIPDLAEKGFHAALEASEAASERSKDILYDLGTLAESRGDMERARSFYVRIFEIDIGYRDVAKKMKSL